MSVSRIEIGKSQNTSSETFHKWLCYLLILISSLISGVAQQDIQAIKTEPITLKLYHRFDSNQDFKLRGSILVRPKSEYRVAQAQILNQVQLTESDLEALKRSSEKGGFYFLKASIGKSGSDKEREVQTLIKSCSLYASNLADFITVNLNPLNEFISVNLFTSDPECTGLVPDKLSTKFNTSLSIDSGSIGPQPDTTTYIKRLEEERQNKLKEGKEDNRSFFAKYWIYIVPAVVVLMMFGGPEQSAR